MLEILFWDYGGPKTNTSKVAETPEERLSITLGEVKPHKREFIAGLDTRYSTRLHVA